MSCVLCDSLVHETDRIVFKNEHVFVLVNLEPLKDGHLMILPIRHAEQLGDLTPEEAQAFLQTIDRCMAAVTETHQETPMCLVNGWNFRTQPHLHAHVLPSKYGLRGLYAAAEGVERRKQLDPETLKQMADKMKALFKPS